MAAEDQKISVAAEWDTLWASVESSAPGLTGILSFFGIAVGAWAVIKWMMDARSGGATRAGKGPLWMLAFASLLIAPTLVIPLVLNIFDIVANLVLGLVGGAVGA
ncbi:hypothetical protein LG293_16970 (plasmid) [Citricoccus nitrophenolicus]